jgi:glycerophosphoryl diester phosphodiesterase
MRAALLPDRPRPLVFAHRGLVAFSPENTMAAFRKAHELGVPGIELDIHATTDGKLAVAHDDTFQRTAPPGNNGDGKKLEELSYEEIRRIDVGSFFGPEFSGEHPPLLEEVLEEFCPAMYVDIELKSRTTKNDPLPALLAEKLKALGKKISAAVTVSSFNPVCLKTFKRSWQQIRESEKLEDIPTAIIFSVNEELPWLLHHGFGRIIADCDYLKPIYKQVNGFSLFRWSAIEGRPVVPWTVDDGAVAEKLVKAGCEGIITNRPQDMAGLWKN